MGRKSRRRVRRASVLTSVWGVGVAVAFAGVIALAGRAGIDLLTTSEEVRAAAKALLPWMVIAPILGVGAYMLDGIFIGATRTVDMRNMMLVSALIYFAAVWLLMPLFGNNGLWAALVLSLCVRAVSLGLRYPALERSAEA